MSRFNPELDPNKRFYDEPKLKPGLLEDYRKHIKGLVTDTPDMDIEEVTAANQLQALAEEYASGVEFENCQDQEFVQQVLRDKAAVKKLYELVEEIRTRRGKHDDMDEAND